MELEGDYQALFSRDFQNKIQILFVKNNTGKYKEIINALNDDDILTAHRLVHTLKGNAGQLNMTALRKISAEVENSLDEGQNKVTEEQLQALKNELEIQLKLLEPLAADAFTAQEQSGRAGESNDRESNLLLLEKLEPMLEMGNPDCRSLISGLCTIPGSGELIQQIDDLDFEKAIVTLAGLKLKI